MYFLNIDVFVTIFFNPSFTKGEGVDPTPKGFSSITFEQNNLETSNFA